MGATLQDLQGWTAAAQALRLDLLGKLLLATVLGGVIGWDRESSGKPAGLRTNILICVGAALLSDLSLRFAAFTVNELVRADPARLVAQVVSGIGFLGAGTILQARGNIIGLTTAATLWVVAAIGIAVGSGHAVEATGATALVLMTLAPLRGMEKYFRVSRRVREVRLEVDRRPQALETLERFLEARGLSIETHGVEQRGENRLALTLEIAGKEEVFRRVRQELAEQPGVHGLRVE